MMGILMMMMMVMMRLDNCNKMVRMMMMLMLLAVHQQMIQSKDSALSSHEFRAFHKDKAFGEEVGIPTLLVKATPALMLVCTPD